MIINPHNMRFTFISQFSSLYTLLYLKLDLCVSIVCNTTKSYTMPPWSHYIDFIKCILLYNTPTQATVFSVLYELIISFKFIANECMFVSAGIYGVVCVFKSGWVSEPSHLQANYNKPFDLAMFRGNQFPSSCVCVCVFSWSSCACFIHFSP